MKTLSKITIGCLLFFLMNGQTQAQSSSGKLKIYMPETDDTYSTSINGFMASKVEQMFPCAKVLTASEVKAMFKLEKMKWTLGSSDNSDFFQNIADGIGADYILTVNFSALGTNNWTMGAALIATHGGKATARAFETSKGSVDDAMFSMIDKVVKKLAEADICPWVGKFLLKAIRT